MGDLDQVIVGNLDALISYTGPFAVLSTDSIACELANGGYNSSVMAWEASSFFRPLYARLTEAVLQFVHRFDHWLEMNIEGADLWQELAPGLIIDYTTAFRGGVCLGSNQEEEALLAKNFGPSSSGSFVEPEEAPEWKATEGTEQQTAQRSLSPQEPPTGAAVVTSPRSPKPHEVLQHPWVRFH